MLKLSHAILEGAQRIQQGFGAYIQTKDNSVHCCSIGMAMLGIGYYNVENNRYWTDHAINRNFPILNATNEYGVTLLGCIIYWNDGLKLPPHEIAMRIASLECKFEREETLDF